MRCITGMTLKQPKEALSDHRNRLVGRAGSFAVSLDDGPTTDDPKLVADSRCLTMEWRMQMRLM